jgi:hypothetical protein
MGARGRCRYCGVKCYAERMTKLAATEASSFLKRFCKRNEIALKNGPENTLKEGM